MRGHTPPCVGSIVALTSTAPPPLPPTTAPTTAQPNCPNAPPHPTANPSYWPNRPVDLQNVCEQAARDQSATVKLASFDPLLGILQVHMTRWLGDLVLGCCVGGLCEWVVGWLLVVGCARMVGSEAKEKIVFLGHHFGPPLEMCPGGGGGRGPKFLSFT